MTATPKLAAIAFGLATCVSGAANAAWQPVKPIEFIATAGPGGGTDNFARAVQSIITKHKLLEQSIVVTNKGGGSGAEGYT
jgi:putative tricarboxylic transport membrane protein